MAKEPTDVDVLDEVLRHFPLPPDAVADDGQLWLTLYLCGGHESFAKARTALAAAGWANLEPATDHAGFSYPKKKIANCARQVRAELTVVLTICRVTGMSVEVIDADTAFDPADSAFRTLFQID